MAYVISRLASQVGAAADRARHAAVRAAELEREGRAHQFYRTRTMSNSPPVGRASRSELGREIQRIAGPYSRPSPRL